MRCCRRGRIALRDLGVRRLPRLPTFAYQMVNVSPGTVSVGTETAVTRSSTPWHPTRPHAPACGISPVHRPVRSSTSTPRSSPPTRRKRARPATYKGGFGFHPLLCFEANRKEALSGILRPGNAGSNTATDHITVLDRALSQLPDGAIGPGTLLRADSAAATHAFLDAVVDAGLSFSVGFDLTTYVCEAILAVPKSAWTPALDLDGDSRDGAWVAELGLDLSAWPQGARAICRRERPHPGAQLSFSDADGWRFQVFLTNQTGKRIARLEQIHRQCAVIADHIRCAKASGLRNLPFRAFSMNEAWLELVLLGCDLLAWAKVLMLQGTELSRCEPKRLRYRLFHVAGRIVHHARGVRLRLPRSWPWADALSVAFARLRALPAA